MSALAPLRVCGCAYAVDLPAVPLYPHASAGCPDDATTATLYDSYSSSPLLDASVARSVLCCC
jgi:hypothetical protein